MSDSIVDIVVFWLFWVPLLAATVLWLFCGAIELITGIEIKDIIREKFKKQ